MTARPLPLYPPSGINSPWNAAWVSVVAVPFASIAQPDGIVASPLLAAAMIFPNATVVVAMSSSQLFGPGTHIEIGLVPRRASFPCHGATRAPALHMLTATKPCAATRCVQNAAAP